MKTNQIDEEECKKLRPYLIKFHNSCLANKLKEEFIALDESVDSRIQELKKRILKKINSK